MSRRKIIEREEAADDAMGIAAYIAARNFDAGLRFLDAVDRDYKRISEFPGIGTLRTCRRPELAGLRSVPVSGFRNWLIFFLSREGEVEIVRVLHGARDLRQEMGVT